MLLLLLNEEVNVFSIEISLSSFPELHREHLLILPVFLSDCSLVGNCERAQEGVAGGASCAGLSRKMDAQMLHGLWAPDNHQQHTQVNGTVLLLLVISASIGYYFELISFVDFR